jgi:hypothetical protein
VDTFPGYPLFAREGQLRIPVLTLLILLSTDFISLFSFFSSSAIESNLSVLTLNDDIFPFLLHIYTQPVPETKPVDS